ncbi:hypothetical protein C8039_16825 [Halogeometricum sp. wsp3]|nr:hypothetical protein C8039_16825 [Halogeometricum sp. wsp3]
MCDTNKYGEITEVVEKPEEPRKPARMSTPARIRLEIISHSIAASTSSVMRNDQLLHSGRTIDAIRMHGWRNDIGYPEDRDQAEERLQGELTRDSRRNHR